MSSQVVVTPVKLVVVSGAPKSNFRSFSHEYENLLNDDYLNKTLTVKYTGKGSNFQLGAKESFAYKTAKVEVEPAKVGEPAKVEPVKEVDTTVFEKEVKIITNVEGRNVETKFYKDGIRVWADFGAFKVGKDSINVTGKVKSSHTFDNFKGWVGGEYSGPHCNANVRLEVKETHVPYLNTKVVIKEKDFRAGLIAKVGLKTFDILRHNLFFNYAVNRDLSVWLGHYTLTGKDSITKTGDKPKDIGTIVGAAVYRLNKHSVVFQGQWQKSTGAILATFGSKSEIDSKTSVRAKVNNKGIFSFVTKRVHNRNLSILAGTELDLTNPSAAYKKDRAVPVPLFLSLEFTYN